MVRRHRGHRRRHRGRVASDEGTRSVYAERIAIDRKALTRYAVAVAEIQEVINPAVGGANITHTVEGRERYPVNLRYPRYGRDSEEKLRELPMVTDSRENIRLQDVAEVRVADRPSVIKSENARPNGWVFITIQNCDLGAYVDEARHLVDEEVELPPDYPVSWSGQHEYLMRAQQRLAYISPLTPATILALLYLSFGGLTQAMMVMVAVPLALVGGF